MALRKTVKKTIEGFSGTLFCEDAYWKVTDIVGTKTNIKFCVCAFSGQTQIDVATYAFTPSVEEGASNFIKQAYEHLKTLSEFADAEDC
jgi:hypothetical protein